MSQDFEQLRAAMIDCQLRPTGVNDVRVLDAFAGVPREAFVPDRLRPLAYLDEDLEIARGRFLMEPLVFGNLLMRAALSPEDSLLLIGAASGYEAAVASRLAGRVVALEEDAALASAAGVALAQTFSFNARVAVGPLTAGWPDGAPYDVVFLAGAVEEIPQGVIEQVAEGGRMVGVFLDEGGVGRAFSARKAGGVIGRNAFMDVAVGRLPGFGRVRAFQF